MGNGHASRWETTYSMAKGAPPPMAWEQYSERVRQEWGKLLVGPGSHDERTIQRFLEQHPCLIPGAFSLPSPSGHWPFPPAVISQPVLQGLNTKIPDFLWIATDSAYLYPVLVEIEQPNKRWFRKDGVPHAELTQALDQLASWRAWFNKPENQSVFFEQYLIPPDMRRWKTFRPFYVLIYGRRSEFLSRPALVAKRGQMARSDEFYMTYDRLQPQIDTRQLICVRKTETRYIAVSVPATLELSPALAHERLVIQEKDKAIERNPWLSPERRKFLLERLPYWDNWARSGAADGTVISSGDRE